MSDYEPPFIPSPDILNLVSEISELIGRLSVLKSAEPTLRLRRINRIKTIQGSLAIEGNTLSEEQITAILQGKRVLASPREVQEVQNALEVYDELDILNPSSQKDLLKAHSILMGELISEKGSFRSGGVGVMKGESVVHMAPPPSMVPTLIHQLMKWQKSTKNHPLIASSIFHYEFEYIHPFADGNGRMGRLWQTLILSKWKPLFAWLPVENLIYRHQKEYYSAIEASTASGNTTPFVLFMLGTIRDALLELDSTPEVTPELTPEVKRLLRALTGEMSKQELMLVLELKDEKNFREKYLKIAIQAGLIERTVPDKPNSRLQKYRLTTKGIVLLKDQGPQL